MHINLNLMKFSIDSCTLFFLNMKLEEFRKRSLWVILMRGPDLGTVRSYMNCLLKWTFEKNMLQYDTVETLLTQILSNIDLS